MSASTGPESSTVGLHSGGDSLRWVCCWLRSSFSPSELVSPSRRRQQKAPSSHIYWTRTWSGFIGLQTLYSAFQADRKVQYSEGRAMAEELKMLFFEVYVHLCTVSYWYANLETCFTCCHAGEFLQVWLGGCSVLRNCKRLGTQSHPAAQDSSWNPEAYLQIQKQTLMMRLSWNRRDTARFSWFLAVQI